MKKKILMALFLILACVIAVVAWFYGYYNRKSNDKDFIPMVVVTGKLYLDTGKESTETERVDGFDGEITSEVEGSKQPIKNNQSNFGTGFGYQYGSQEDTIEIYINDKWRIFATEEARQQMLFPTREDGNALEDGYSRYQDGVFGFSVDFPVTWICESEGYWYATEEYEASPSSGVKIYIDSQKKDYIWVYGQNGTITTNFVVQSNYKKTVLDENRELYILESDGILAAQLFYRDNKHLSATIRMNVQVYNEHEEEIMKLLESIRCL